MMETGIHLPAINALFHGGVAYRDFFFLRGPLELYVPAFFMLLFGKNMTVLPTFYYGGTVLTLLFCVFIAGHLYRTRLILYLMILVLVARTFPRVSYYYWGGLRYALGFLAVLCVVYYFKKQKPVWLFVGGIVSSMALLTAMESGICAMSAVIAALLFSLVLKIQSRHSVGQSLRMYLYGIMLILLLYGGYLIVTNSFVPFIQTTSIVLTRMTSTFIDAKGNHPEGIHQFILSLLPGNRYFKIMTPIYCYFFFVCFLIWRIRKKKIDNNLPILVTLAVYGLILYLAAFRKIEGHHFEMALQPEKFLLFFLFEEVTLAFGKLKEQISLHINDDTLSNIHRALKTKVLFMNIFFFILIVFSLGYALQRYDHRFTVVKLIKKHILGREVKGLTLLDGMEKEVLALPRAEGMVVPRWQAEEIKEVVEFIKIHTAPNEIVFTYPELGDFNFLADRPFVGRFPIVTFTWMYEPWHRELVDDFKRAKPKYVIMTNLGHRTFPAEWYFRNPRNRVFFNEFMELILANYKLKKTYDSVSIYELK